MSESGYHPDKFYLRQQGVEGVIAGQTQEELEADQDRAKALGVARKIASGEIKIDPSRKADAEKLKSAVNFVSEELGKERLKRQEVRSDSRISNMTNVLEALKNIQNSLPEPKKSIIGKLGGLFRN